ncbi:TonB-dependent receptor [Lunatimonas lonarensis]|uniref:TonB-dependent receptor n=2 Tax=Lunatimonas lonarensis TaxID=1232681 RepID=R7ZQE4_9BACT|nr:TonB-dependent receptor [Lunatimonas lonarensis]
MLFHYLDVNAQQAGGESVIKGRIIEDSSGEPVPYASAALVEVEASQRVMGAVADIDGKFQIGNVKPGAYQLKVSFVGYSTFESGLIEVAENQRSIDLGTIKLASADIALEEVVVVGQRDLIEEKVDRTIYNAEHDRTLLGGDASDVLRRVPMLSVDMDGNVSMRGSSNILVLIDGKQSAIVASNVSDALKQIPAEEIKTVEVITSPSAKYDAEGTGGVINIVTKKSNLQGMSLNINSTAGWRASNLGLNASLKTGKMGFTLGGFGRAGYNILGSFANEQWITHGDGNTLHVLQRATTQTNQLFGRYNFGWDYEIDTHNFLMASVGFGLRNRSSHQDGLLTDTYLGDDLLASVLRDVEISNLSNNMDVSFNYTKTFEQKGKEFSASTLYSVNNLTDNFINSLYLGTFDDIASRIRNNNLGRNEEFTLQLDYINPLGGSNGPLLEYGAKTILRRAESDFTYFRAEGPEGPYEVIDDLALSNEFSYHQNVTAGYFTFMSNFLTDYTFKGGLRYEYTHINADFGNAESTADITSYGILVPSMNLSRKLENGNMIKMAYNRRVQRPFLNFLNPNINAANPQQISQGNPFLDPELTDNYEMSYSTYLLGSSFNVTGYMRNTTGSIQPVRTVMDDDVIFTTFENIGGEKAYGLSLFTNVNVSNKFSLSGSVDSYFARLENGLTDPMYAASNSGFVLSGRARASYQLENNWQLEAFGFARGRQVQLQGSAGSLAIYNLNINKQFNDKKGSIGFGIENFLTREFTMRNELITPTILQQSTVGLQNMSFKINFNYRLGKLSTDSRKKQRGVTNDDIKGSGDSDATVN